MKKLFIATLLALTVATSAFANPGSSVNSNVAHSFKVAFKNATDVSWSMSGEYAKASFVQDETRMEAYYGLDGEMIGTSKAITLDELSLTAKRTVAKKLDGYNVIEAILFEGRDESSYFISAENETEKVILKVDSGSQVSTYKRTKK